MENKFLENIALRLSPKVLQHISSNIYRQPASAFKELASNAFDASARKFEIAFIINTGQVNGQNEPILQRIEVFDDGNGISFDDFYSIFSNIGNSKKVSDLEYDSQDKMNKDVPSRPIIGRIGIGLFSVVAASDEFEIESKKKGEPCYVARTYLPDFARLNVTNIDLSQFNTGEAQIFQKEEGCEEDRSYTKISIQKFKKPFLDDVMENFNESEIYNMAQIRTYSETDDEAKFKLLLENWTKNTDKIEDSKGKIDRFVYNLSMMLPIEYLSDGPFKDCVKLYGDNNPEGIIQEIKQRLTSYDFSVYFTIKFENSERPPLKIKLFKPIYFPVQRDIDKYGLTDLYPRAFLYKKKSKIINEIGDNVDIEISMYAYRQGHRIIPHELRGILFRVYDVAIGTYDYEKLRPFTTSALQFQASFEIFMDKGFQSAVNVDRESLYEASYSYRYLKQYFKYIIEGIPEEDVEDNSSKESLPKDKNIASEMVSGTLANAEHTFSSQLKKEFMVQNPKPLIEELNKLKELVTKNKRSIRIEKEKKNPVLGMINSTLQTKLETIDQIIIEESNGDLTLVKEDNKVILQSKFEPDKKIRISFMEILILVTLKLAGEDRKNFLEGLESRIYHP